MPADSTFDDFAFADDWPESERERNIRENKRLGYPAVDDDPLAAVRRASFGDEPFATTAPPVTARVVTMSTVERERIDWLWRQWIARGMLNLIDGDPGVGKSTITIDLTARTTKGEPMPFATERAAPADVLLIGAEDHLAATVRPRLDAAGADLTRVHVLEAVPRQGDPDAPPTLADVYEVEALIAAKSIALVVIDPVMAHLPNGTDAYRDSDMRGLLSPWAAMAQRTGAAILIVRHLRKMGGSAVYRGGGTIGIIGAARSAMLVGRDPEDAETCVLAHSKGNLAPPPKSLRYRVVDCDGVGRIEWLGVADGVTADHLACLPDTQRDELDPVDAVCDALRQLLAGGPRLTKDVEKDVAGMTGASKRTIERARSKLGVVAKNQSATVGGWTLELPGGGLPNDEDRLSRVGGGLPPDHTSIVGQSLDIIHTATSAHSSGGLGGVAESKSHNAASATYGGERQTSWSSAVYSDARHRGLHDDGDDE